MLKIKISHSVTCSWWIKKKSTWTALGAKYKSGFNKVLSGILNYLILMIQPVYLRRFRFSRKQSGRFKPISFSSLDLVMAFLVRSSSLKPLHNVLNSLTAQQKHWNSQSPFNFLWMTNILFRVTCKATSSAGISCLRLHFQKHFRAGSEAFPFQ